MTFFEERVAPIVEKIFPQFTWSSNPQVHYEHLRGERKEGGETWKAHVMVEILELMEMEKEKRDYIAYFNLTHNGRHLVTLGEAHWQLNKNMSEKDITEKLKINVRRVLLKGFEELKNFSDLTENLFRGI